MMGVPPDPFRGGHYGLPDGWRGDQKERPPKPKPSPFGKFSEPSIEVKASVSRSGMYGRGNRRMREK